MLVVTSKIENSTRGEDRAVVRLDRDRLLVVVADGAGGTSAGAAAAEAVCDAVLKEPAVSTEGWTDLLREIDLALSRSRTGGLSTAVVVEVHGWTLWGASVGDSAAWLVRHSEVVDLTERQQRKPLIGSGDSKPTPFGPVPLDGRLLVASDGLFKYVRRAEIQQFVSAPPQFTK